MSIKEEYSHYFKNVENLSHIDVYRVLELFNVTNPCIQHAVKKLLVAGTRGQKAAMGWDMGKDVAEAIVSLQRWQQMQVENEQEPKKHFKVPPYVENSSEHKSLREHKGK